MLTAILFFLFLHPSTYAQDAVDPNHVVKFETKQLVFNNGVRLTVEVAKTEEQRSRGLMFRTQLAPDTGMLFIFPNEIPLGFWMKNTLLPLTIGYFNKKKVLGEILDMDPPIGPVRDEQLARYASKEPCLYALEVPRGWFAAKKIKPGATFTLK